MNKKMYKSILLTETFLIIAILLILLSNNFVYSKDFLINYNNMALRKDTNGINPYYFRLDFEITNNTSTEQKISDFGICQGRILGYSDSFTSKYQDIVLLHIYNSKDKKRLDFDRVLPPSTSFLFIAIGACMTIDLDHSGGNKFTENDVILTNMIKNKSIVKEFLMKWYNESEIYQNLLKKKMQLSINAPIVSIDSNTVELKPELDTQNEKVVESNQNFNNSIYIFFYYAGICAGIISAIVGIISLMHTIKYNKKETNN